MSTLPKECDRFAMLTITRIPAFNDNYIWLLTDPQKGRCFVVDPGDADAVEAACKQYGVVLAGILITHHHHDHTGGIAQLTQSAAVPVYGPKNEKIAGITQTLQEGDRIDVLGISLSILETPGHTAGHISYFGNCHSPVLFCGDTLFAGGCGRLFEGTAEQLHASLNKLSALPGETLVYCAHEYTLANLAFARAVEPANARLKERHRLTVQLRREGRATVPSSIADERATNPFLRTCEQPVQRSVEEHSGKKLQSGTEVFAALRRWKDTF